MCAERGGAAAWRGEGFPEERAAGHILQEEEAGWRQGDSAVGAPAARELSA